MRKSKLFLFSYYLAVFLFLFVINFGVVGFMEGSGFVQGGIDRVVGLSPLAGVLLLLIGAVGALACTWITCSFSPTKRQSKP